MGCELSRDERNFVRNETILSGDLCNNDRCNSPTHADDNSYHVITGHHARIGAILDGFTISGGSARIELQNVCGHCAYGGGFTVFAETPDAGSPTIRNCKFDDNVADLGGGAFVGRGNPTFENCTFSNNYAEFGGGGLYTTGGAGPPFEFADTEVIDCDFIDNSAKGPGGGACITNSSPVFTNCVFHGNSVVAPLPPDPLCPPGDPLCQRAGGLAITSVFTGLAVLPEPKIVNCTFVENDVPSGVGGGLWYLSIDPAVPSPELHNCILWGNTDDGTGSLREAQFATKDLPILLTYSDVQGLLPSDLYSLPPNIGNIPDQPTFVSLPTGNVRLVPGSAGNDAGNNVELGVPYDRDGLNRRIEDTIADNTGNGTLPLVDMGAYECCCVDGNDCGDARDHNGRIDDNCLWYSCANDLCTSTERDKYADGGSATGGCALDGFCNLADATHALTCFNQTNPCDSINFDYGGPLGNCTPDGFCNLADALHALTCFAGTSTCTCPPTCPGGSASAMQGPGTVGTTELVAVPVPLSLSPNVRRVRVFSKHAIRDFVGYQLDVAVSGGTAGQLELLDITIEPRADFIFAGRTDTLEAVNVSNGQMLCLIENMSGAPAAAHAYLATYTYRVPPTAQGDFVVDFLLNESTGDQTMMVAANNGRVEVGATAPAVLATAAAVP